MDSRLSLIHEFGSVDGLSRGICLARPTIETDDRQTPGGVGRVEFVGIRTA